APDLRRLHALPALGGSRQIETSVPRRRETGRRLPEARLLREPAGGAARVHGAHRSCDEGHEGEPDREPRGRPPHHPHPSPPAPTARCPRAVVVRGRMERYVAVSRQLRQIFRRFTPLVEPLSLDEAFLDVTASTTLFGPPPEIAHQIRRAVRAETGLTASAGVAPNKFIAKIASDLAKPDGQLVVPPE